MSPAFVFVLLAVAGLVALTFWGGRRLPASHLVTEIWLVIAGLGFVVVAQSYLDAAFRVIDSGTVVLVAVPEIEVPSMAPEIVEQTRDEIQRERMAQILGGDATLPA